MREEELRKLDCIYENYPAGIAVYHGEFVATNLPIIIKEMQFLSVSDASEAVEEALKQTRLNAHSNVTTVYGVTLSQRLDKYVVSLALERLDTDLYQEIEARARDGRYWGEGQLWVYLHAVISALEYAQTCELCHRDIKPQNLFIKSDGTIKVGDFGSAKHFAFRMSASTLKGSPYFLSPLLKRAYLESLGRIDLQVVHNMFKSDVYSLGLTMLYMAKLGPSMGLAKIEGLQETAKEEIAALQYSEGFKGLLGFMLMEEESLRPDFCTIKQWLWVDQPEKPVLEQSRSSYYSTDVSSNPRPSVLPEDFLESSKSSNQSLSIPKPLPRPIPFEIAPILLASVDDCAPMDLVQDINSELTYEKLACLVLNQGPYQLLADVSLPVKCQNCSNTYDVYFTHGPPTVPEMLFCSQTCLKQYSIRPFSLEPSIPPANRAVPMVVSVVPVESGESMQKEYKASFSERKARNICIACGERPIEDTDLSACSKCISKQERRFHKFNSEECALCHKKWPKQSKISKWFRKKKLGNVTLPCEHQLCSMECLREIVSGRLRCPRCNAAIREDFLRFMKVSNLVQH
jgi:serine/threonine protein kinase